jgi:outer membrane protein
MASAETISQALALAYSSNPEINAARAQTRADDEAVPIARSGYRPIVSLFSTVISETNDSQVVTDSTTLDSAVGLSVSQNIFSGFRVRNNIRASEAGVLASRELLRNTVENVLLDAATAYFDVIREQAILNLRDRNVIFLDEQLSAANERFSVGENTKTDVSQTRARLASGRAATSLAEANLADSRASYHRIIGHEPSNLTSKFPYARLIPAELSQAISRGQNDHPIVLASIHQADAQAFVVKRLQGERLPTVSISGSIVHNESFDTNIDPNTLTVLGRLSIPLYQGGLVSAEVRQAKEEYGLRQIAIDQARDEVRAAVVSAWARMGAAAEAITAAEEGVKAANDALSGVEEEQRVGQRTTLDILDAQQELLQTEEILVGAQRVRMVAAFALLSAMGRLTLEQLDLPTESYDPAEHYDAVKNRWFGELTPDGR